MQIKDFLFCIVGRDDISLLLGLLNCENGCAAAEDGVRLAFVLQGDAVILCLYQLEY